MGMIRYVISIQVLICCIALSTASCGNTSDSGKRTLKQDKEVQMSEARKNSNEKMKVIMSAGGRRYNVELLDTKASKDFYNALPLKIKLTDYANAEKVSEPGKKFNFDISDSPKASAGKPGDISLYTPWGNIAIFYKDGPYAEGLVKLGHIVEGGKWLERHERDFEVAFERDSF